MATHTIADVTVSENAVSPAVTGATPQPSVERVDYEAFGITSVTDALHRMPSITLRDYGGAGGLKTVAVRGLDTKHTGVCIDGVMVSNNQSGEVDLSRYNIDDIQSMTLGIGLDDDIFKPARQAAYPAVLMLSSMNPQADSTHSHTTARLASGSFGYVRPYVCHQQNITPALALAASVSYIRADNCYPFELKNVQLVTTERRTHNSIESLQTELDVAWKPTTSGVLHVKALYYDSDRDLPGQVHLYTSLSRETLGEREALAQVHYEEQLSQRLSLRSSAKFTWDNTDYRDPLYQAGTTSATYYQREGYITSALLYRLNSRLSASYAADYTYNNLNSSLTTDNRPRRHTIQQAASMSYKSTRLTSTAQLLWAGYINATATGADADDYDHLSPAISLSYRILPARSLFVRASYKNLFRAPSFNECYYFHYGSPDLQPERTDQWNVGLTWAETLSRSWHVQLTLDGYLNHVKDKIVAIPRNLFVWQCINLGKVRVVGLDASLDASWHMSKRHTLQTRANYSLQQSTNRTNRQSPYYGNQLAYMPEHICNVAISWHNPWVNISLQGEGISHTYSTNEHHDGTRLAGYWEAGCTVWRDITLRQHNLKLRFDVKNLFDRQYEIVKRYPMPGRNFLASVELSL